MARGHIDAEAWLAIDGDGPHRLSVLLGEAGTKPSLDIAEFRRRYLECRTPPEAVFPGAHETLRTLARHGIRLAVCAAKPQDLCERVLRETGLLPYFATVHGMVSGRPLKPDADHLLQTLARTAKWHRACYVGDAEVDRALAANARVPFVHVRHERARGYPANHSVPSQFPQVTASVLKALGIGD